MSMYTSTMPTSRVGSLNAGPRGSSHRPMMSKLSSVQHRAFSKGSSALLVRLRTPPAAGRTTKPDTLVRAVAEVSGSGILTPNSRLALQLETTRAELKASLLDATAAGFDISSSDRNVVNELLSKLESLNPTKSPAFSPKLNGTWAMAYVPGITKDSSWLFFPIELPLQMMLSSGALSPAHFGLEAIKAIPSALCKVDDFTLTISPDQPRVDAQVTFRLLTQEFSVGLRNLVDVKSDTRLTEKYQDAAIMGVRIPIPRPMRYQRQVFVTYVDSDILLCRDDKGQPYVLVRSNEEGGEGGSPTLRKGLQADVDGFAAAIQTSEEAVERARQARIRQGQAEGATAALSRADESYERAQKRLAKVQKTLSKGRSMSKKLKGAAKSAAAPPPPADGGGAAGGMAAAIERPRDFLKAVFPRAYEEEQLKKKEKEEKELKKEEGKAVVVEEQKEVAVAAEGGASGGDAGAIATEEAVDAEVEGAAVAEDVGEQSAEAAAAAGQEEGAAKKGEEGRR